MYVTKQTNTDKESPRDRPDSDSGVPQIEVTPEMIDAGASVFSEWVEICPPGSLVLKVFLAMRALETADHRLP